MSDQTPASNVTRRTEQTLLSSLILSPKLVLDVAVALQPTDFVDPNLGTLFEAFCGVEGTLEESDIAAWLLRNGHPRLAEAYPAERAALIDIGGATSRTAVVGYATRIKSDAERRKARDRFTLAASELSDPAHTLSDVLARIQTDMDSGSGQPEQQTMVELARIAYEAVLYRQEHGVDENRIATGLGSLDRLLNGGMLPGQLCVIGARPGMGKTAFAGNVALNCAEAGHNVVLFSAEMTPIQLVDRFFLARGRYDGKRWEAGQLSHEELGRLGSVHDTISGSSIQLVSAAGWTVDSIRRHARREKARTGLNVVIIDYLQLIAPTQSRRQDNRQTEIAEISRALKQLAIELDIVVIALSQLSRSIDTRADKRPNLSDLRESGAIEQDADLVFFIFRDEYYDPMSERRGVADIILAKNRFGANGTVALTFVPNYQLFVDDLADASPYHADSAPIF